MKGDIEAIRGLLECPDADINLRDTGGRTLLYLASFNGHTDAVNELLEQSFHDMDGEDEASFLLHLASVHGHANVTEQLLEHYKLDIDMGRTVTGGTAFSIAAEKGYHDILNLLIGHDTPADVNKGWCMTNWTPQLILCDYINYQSMKASTPTAGTAPTIGLYKV